MAPYARHGHQHARQQKQHSSTQSQMPEDHCPSDIFATDETSTPLEKRGGTNLAVPCDSKVNFVQIFDFWHGLQKNVKNVNPFMRKRIQIMYVSRFHR
jgi:hypothetical protein